METLLASPDPDAMTRRLAELIAAGRVGAARPMLAALRQLGPPSPRVAELAALLDLHEGRIDFARAELDSALLRYPHHPALHRRRAELRQRMGDLTGAALDAADAVVLEPSNAGGKALLGVLMTELGRPADGVRCLREAVGAAPSDAGFLQALANAHAVNGELNEAATVLSAGIAAAPDSTDLRRAAVLLAVRRRRFDDALELAEAARRDGIVDASVFGLKGLALSKLGRHAEATEAFQEALKLAPDDPYVRHLEACSTPAPVPDRAAPEFVRAVFDEYADRFDMHLISLGYRIPGVIRAAVSHHLPLQANQRIGPVLDLGCGTGLVGVAISDLPIGPLIGVDVSPRMLLRAEAKQLYAELHEAEIVNFLAAHARQYPLIIAADVLCYFGAIAPLMVAVAARLQPGGFFIASFEERTPADPAHAWELGARGRYMHNPAHVTAVARSAGLNVVAMDTEIIRKEADFPVHGRLAVLRRPLQAD